MEQEQEHCKYCGQPAVDILVTEYNGNIPLCISHVQTPRDIPDYSVAVLLNVAQLQHRAEMEVRVGRL